MNCNSDVTRPLIGCSGRAPVSAAIVAGLGTKAYDRFAVRKLWVTM